MKTLDEALRIINGSKQFSFNGSILEITGYYTGETIRLDLSLLDDEMLETLQAEDEYYEEED